MLLLAAAIFIFSIILFGFASDAYGINKENTKRYFTDFGKVAAACCH
jgi:hypothetical protein